MTCSVSTTTATVLGYCHTMLSAGVNSTTCRPTETSVSPLASRTAAYGAIEPLALQTMVPELSTSMTRIMEDRMATTLAPDDVEQLWIEFKKDISNQELRNRLVEMYLPLVKYNGERIWARLPEGVELDDLISAGVFGLMDAIDAFDLSRGVKFETYCVPRIRGAMLDELRTMDWVPRLVRSKASKLNEAMKTLEAKLGRQPTEIELSAGHEHFRARAGKNDARRQRRQSHQPE